MHVFFKPVGSGWYNTKHPPSRPFISTALQIMTPSQQRTFELFQTLACMDEDDFVRATVVGRRLMEEGIAVETGLFRQISRWSEALDDDEILDLEVLQVEGSLIDARGVFGSWDEWMAQYAEIGFDYRDTGPKVFAPQDPHWLGSQSVPMIEKMTALLNSEIQKKSLDKSTPSVATDRSRMRL